MPIDETSTRRKQPNYRSMLDYFMALLMVFFGFFILASKTLIGYDYFEDSWLLTGAMRWIVAIVFILYGVFRAYRGYMISKNN